VARAALCRHRHEDLELTMTTRVAANGMCHSSDSLKCGEQGMDIPKGHVGPVLLSDTGRKVCVDWPRGYRLALPGASER
jgi:hypothetical protein